MLIREQLRRLSYPLAATAYFAFCRASTRPFKNLLWAVPSILLVLPILLAATWSASGGREKAVARYHLAVADARVEHDYARAKLFERKLAQLGAVSSTEQVHENLTRTQNLMEQALANDPTNALAWNDLACVLLQQPNARLDVALNAANRSIELQPKECRFHATRGRIHLRLSRWQEAVEDLEYALNGMPDVRTIHQALSDAYQALGNEQLADIHRQYAAAFASGNSESPQ